MALKVLAYSSGSMILYLVWSAERHACCISQFQQTPKFPITNIRYTMSFERCFFFKSTSNNINIVANTGKTLLFQETHYTYMLLLISYMRKQGF